MLEPPLFTEINALSSIQKKGFGFFHKKEFLLLKSMPDMLETISKPDKTNTEKYNADEAWAVKLNQPETWDAFYAANPTWAHQIKRLHDLQNKQKEFVLCSNQQLLKSLDEVLLSLQCIEKARLEFTFKDMIKQWQSILENLYQSLTNQQKKSGIEAGQQRLVEGLKNNHPKPSPKNYLVNTLKTKLQTQIAEKENNIQTIEKPYTSKSFFN